MVPWTEYLTSRDNHSGHADDVGIWGIYQIVGIGGLRALTKTSYRKRRCDAMSFVEQTFAPALTPELWAKVFAYVEEVAETIGPLDDIVENQTAVQQLKLVCKQYRDIHASHSNVVQHLYLGDVVSVDRLPSLLAWLQQSQCSVKVFQSYCGSPLVDDVLAAQAFFKQSVKMVKLCCGSTSSIPIVAKFMNLKKCVRVQNSWT